MQLPMELMGCSRVKKMVLENHGQATVEFALVLAGFLALLVALGALADFASSGAFAQHARSTASHHVAGETGAWVEVLAY